VIVSESKNRPAPAFKQVFETIRQWFQARAKEYRVEDRTPFLPCPNFDLFLQMTEPSDWPSTGASFIGDLQARSSGPAWDQFVDVYGPLVYRFCRRRRLQDADARDVTQAVFLAVRQGIRRFQYDPSRARFRTWLGTIVVRAIARSNKNAQRAGTVIESSSEIEGSDGAWVVEFNSYIYQAAMDRIRPTVDERTWSAFDLLWNHDKRPVEVASHFQKSIDWVYQVKIRMLRRLEKEIRFLTADIPSFNKD
jgi:RNA polymerase sigma-70 factor (ECF subfamily)